MIAAGAAVWGEEGRAEMALVREQGRRCKREACC